MESGVGRVPTHTASIHPKLLQRHWLVQGLMQKEVTKQTKTNLLIVFWGPTALVLKVVDDTLRYGHERPIREGLQTKGGPGTCWERQTRTGPTKGK